MGSIRLVVQLFTAALLAGCTPSLLVGKKPDGTEIQAKFYPGGSKLDDLIIIEDVNHFGKASYPFNDALGDVGFRFNTGERVRAECVAEGKNSIGDIACVMYQVYRSNFGSIPEGTLIPKPGI